MTSSSFSRSLVLVARSPITSGIGRRRLRILASSIAPRMTYVGEQVEKSAVTERIATSSNSLRVPDSFFMNPQNANRLKCPPATSQRWSDWVQIVHELYG